MSELGSHHEEVTALLRKAGMLLDLKRPGDALELASQAVARFPDELQAHCFLARALDDLGRHSEALAAIETALGLGLNSEWAHRLRSCSLSALGRDHEAVAAAKTAVRLDPESAAAWKCLADCELKLRHLGPAREAAERVLKLEPEEPFGHAQAGRVARAAGRMAEAEGHYRRALELDPECLSALLGLGYTLSTVGREHEAMEILYRGVRASPDTAVLRQTLLSVIEKKLDPTSSTHTILGCALVFIAPVLLLGQGAWIRRERARRLALLPPEIREFYEAEHRR